MLRRYNSRPTRHRARTSCSARLMGVLQTEMQCPMPTPLISFISQCFLEFQFLNTWVLVEMHHFTVCHSRNIMGHRGRLIRICWAFWNQNSHAWCLSWGRILGAKCCYFHFPSAASFGSCHLPCQTRGLYSIWEVLTSGRLLSFLIIISVSSISIARTRFENILHLYSCFSTYHYEI